MGDLARYFSTWELICHCNDDNCPGKSTKPSAILLGGLDKLREFSGCAININSGIRCKDHNTKKGGSDNSRHLPQHADAADVVIQGKNVREMVDLALKIACFRYGGIGIYQNRIHLDTRPYLARWPKGMWRNQTEFLTYDEMENQDEK